MIVGEAEAIAPSASRRPLPKRAARSQTPPPGKPCQCCCHCTCLIGAACARASANAEACTKCRVALLPPHMRTLGCPPLQCRAAQAVQETVGGDVSGKVSQAASR